MIGTEKHEVDSIVDFQENFANKNRFQIALCCECCVGRLVWLCGDTLFKYGNECLKDLAKQTIQLQRAGLEISSKNETAFMDLSKRSILDELDECEDSDPGENASVYFKK